MKSVTALVEEILLPFLEKEGLELYDLAFVKEGPNRYLRVFIDGEKGISLEDCEKVSNYLNESLDQRDPIKEQYYLEVSSPGIERLLKKESHYKKYIGERIKLNLFTTFEGQKVLTGKLLDRDSEFVRLLDDCTAKEMAIPVALVSKAQNIVEF